MELLTANIELSDDRKSLVLLLDGERIRFTADDVINLDDLEALATSVARSGVEVQRAVTSIKKVMRGLRLMDPMPSQKSHKRPTGDFLGIASLEIGESMTIEETLAKNGAVRVYAHRASQMYAGRKFSVAKTEIGSTVTRTA